MSIEADDDCGHHEHPDLRGLCMNCKLLKVTRERGEWKLRANTLANRGSSSAVPIEWVELAESEKAEVTRELNEANSSLEQSRIICQEYVRGAARLEAENATLRGELNEMRELALWCPKHSATLKMGKGSDLELDWYETFDGIPFDGTDSDLLTALQAAFHASGREGKSDGEE